MCWQILPAVCRGNNKFHYQRCMVWSTMVSVCNCILWLLSTLFWLIICFLVSDVICRNRVPVWWSVWGRSNTQPECHQCLRCTRCQAVVTVVQLRPRPAGVRDPGMERQSREHRCGTGRVHQEINGATVLVFSLHSNSNIFTFHFFVCKLTWELVCWFGWSVAFVKLCVSVCAVKETWLELSTPNMVHTYSYPEVKR